jgi:hypothetical protein
MKKYNLNQKKAISNLLISLSAALLSVTIVTPIFSKITYNFLVFIAIFSIFVLSLVMIVISIYILK